MDELLKGPSNERNRKDLIVKAICDTTETSFSQKNFVWCQPWHVVGGLHYNLPLSFVGCHSLPALTRQILNRPLFNLYLRRIVQYLLQLHPSAFRKQSTSQSLALAWIPPRSGEQCFSIYIQQKMLY